MEHTESSSIKEETTFCSSKLCEIKRSLLGRFSSSCISWSRI